MVKPINTAREKTSDPKVRLKYRCESCSSKKGKFKSVKVHDPFIPTE